MKTERFGKFSTQNFWRASSARLENIKKEDFFDSLDHHQGDDIKKLMKECKTLKELFFVMIIESNYKFDDFLNDWMPVDKIQFWLDQYKH